MPVAEWLPAVGVGALEVTFVEGAVDGVVAAVFVDPQAGGLVVCDETVPLPSVIGAGVEWKVKTPARPTTVPATTIGVRFMLHFLHSCSVGVNAPSEGERRLVNSVASSPTTRVSVE